MLETNPDANREKGMGASYFPLLKKEQIGECKTSISTRFPSSIIVQMRKPTSHCGV